MLDQATLAVTKGVDMADIRYRLRNAFAIVHPDLVLENFDQLEPDTIQFLAITFHRLILDMVKDASPSLAAHLKVIQCSITSAYDNELVKPLIKAIFADQHDDTTIWTSFFKIAPLPNEVPSPPSSSVAPSISIQTPLRPTATGIRDTPFRYSSASQKGNEQRKKDLRNILLREFENSVYRTVKEFDEKYFQNQAWSSRAQSVFEAMKPQHINRKWDNLGTRNSQDDMLSWLFSMQKQFLSKEKYYYDTIESPRELIGGETRRQIDVILKRRNRNLHNGGSHLKDIMAIGELKASTSEGVVEPPFLQLARYARDVFASQPTRPFLHAFTLYGSQLETYIFDRSGCYSPGSFNIHKSPERFIRIIAGYTMMDEFELGVNTFLKKDDNSSFIRINGTSGEMVKFRLAPEPMTQQKAIVSRATTVFLTKNALSDSWDCVTKFSWPPSKLQSESELLKLANERGVEGIPKLLGTFNITEVAELRSGLVFKDPYPLTQGRGSAQATKRKSQVSDAPSAKRSKSSSQQFSLQGNTLSINESISPAGPAATAEKFNTRIFRCIVTSPTGKPIYEFESHLELITALRDAIRAHRSLFTKGEILHRDISENNIIIVNPKENDFFSGILIDFDLAQLNGMPSSARSRTGTIEFMAIGVLGRDPHTYRHDLESFFYVLLWQCVRADIRAGEGQKKQGQKAELPLYRWYQGTFEEVRDAKLAAMIHFFENEVLSLFLERFDNIKPLCRALRMILFQQSFGLTTPENPDVLYDPIIEAFNKAISELTPASVAVDLAEPCVLPA